MNLLDIRDNIRNCNACSLKLNTLMSCFDDNGNLDSNILFIGEAEGKQESINGQPFQGKSGKLVDKLLHSINLNRSDVFIANLVNCRPVKEGTDADRTPTKEEIEFCKHFLLEIIDVMKPKLIITLGGSSFNGLIGDKDIPVSEILLGNHPDKWNYNDIPIWPLYHPSFILRDYNLRIQNYWENWISIGEYINEHRSIW